MIDPDKSMRRIALSPIVAIGDIVDEASEEIIAMPEKNINIPMTKNAIHVPVNAPKRDDTNLFIIFAVSQTSFF